MASQSLVDSTILTGEMSVAPYNNVVERNQTQTVYNSNKEKKVKEELGP